VFDQSNSPSPPTADKLPRPSAPSTDPLARVETGWWIVESFAIVLLCFAIAGWPAPGVNEAHYWGKAKHAWDPTWCPRDIFLTSPDAHLFYTFTWGSLTRVMPLPHAAWLGRGLGWLAIAVAWTYFVAGFAPRRGAALFGAAIWFTAVHYGQLGGEWIVGGTEAKVPAYACVLVALGCAVRDRWRAVWPWLGLASAFHVLVGGWTTLVLLASGFWWSDFRAAPWPFIDRLLGGGALALLGLIPALLLSIGAAPGDAQAAAEIYVFHRLPHHLWALSFSLDRFLSFSALLILTYGFGALSRCGQRLRVPRALAFGGLALTLIGLLLSAMASWAPTFSSQLLRLYLFRLADVSVPLLCGAIFACWYAYGLDSSIRTISLCGGLVAATAGLGLVSWDAISWEVPPACRQSLLALTPDVERAEGAAVWRDWVNVCEWIKEHTPSDELLLTPRHQQTFKWYAGRSEVANWKDIPQDASGLVAWQQRLRDIYPARLGGTRVSIRFAELKRLAREYGVRWLVADRRLLPELPLVRIYPTGSEQNAHFAVYRLPSHESAEQSPAP
jgi:hypothetical protein